MPLTYYERKARLPHGAVKRVAADQGCCMATVSHVLSGKLRNRAIETRLAALMREPQTDAHVTVTDAFGAPGRSLRKARNGAAA